MKPAALLALAGILLAGCKSGYTLTGEIPDLEQSTVYLCTAEDYPADLIVLDSARVEQGRFMFEGRIPHSALGYLSLDGRKTLASFILENAPIRIEGRLADRKSFVAASPLNDSLAQFQRQLERFAERRKGTRGEELDAIQEELYDYTYRTVVNNADNFLAVRILSRYPTGFRSARQMLDAIDRLSEPMQRHYMIRRYLRPQIEQSLRTDVGQPYRDIAAPTPAGDTLSLRQAVEDPANKCVLVDFWASWCGPCISGMNRIKQLYETYRAAGLEVIGVSLDSRREAWLRAIEKEGLPWSNLSNLDGWQTGFDSYGIQSLPSFVLIRCSDGQIVARKPWGRASHIPVGEIEKLLGQ